VYINTRKLQFVVFVQSGFDVSQNQSNVCYNSPMRSCISTTYGVFLQFLLLLSYHYHSYHIKKSRLRRRECAKHSKGA